MLKIKKITIENFRGIKTPFEIDFSKSGDPSVAIYGRNGTGKSSIVDAWEWINNDFKIAHLNREGISQKDYPHNACDGLNSSVQLDLQYTSPNTLKITYNKSKPTTPTILGDYPLFKSYSYYPNYLRYADLRDFVYKTKKEKYEYIARFFGLEAYLKSQSELQAYITKLELKINQEQTKFDKLTEEIENIIGLQTITETEIVNYINTLASKHGIATIKQFKECKQILNKLKKQVEENPKTKELVEWKSFQLKLNQFYPLSKVKIEAEELEKIFEELKKDEANFTKLILSNLYKIGTDIIPQLENKTICPLCDNKFEGNLLEHVKEKHKSLDALNKKKTDFEKKQAALLRTFNSLSKKIAIIQSEPGAIVLLTMEELFNVLEEISLSVPEITEVLTSEVTEIEVIKLGTQPFIDKIDDLVDNEEIHKKSVTDKITELESDVTRKTLAEDYHSHKKLITDYFNYIVSEKGLSHLKTTKSNFDKLFHTLTLFIQNKIQVTFGSISANVIDYFNILETANPHIKNPEIKLILGKDKAVELEIEFVSTKITPAFKFLSESQVNSFGLSIFLAAVRHFNSSFKFIILDDVVSSFDAFKRPKLIDLLNTKFNDFQILMLTHDDVFFTELSRHLPKWNRIKFTGWNYTTGPTYKIAKNYHEQILDAITDDDAETAGQKLGKYLEWILSDINENMESDIRYTKDSNYTLSELFPAARKQFEKKLKSGTKVHSVVKLFTDLENSSSFRNFVVHYKNVTVPYTSIEIKEVYDKWLGIENLIYCVPCKKFVKLDRTTSGDFVRCNDGHINLLDSFYFS